MDSIILNKYTQEAVDLLTQLINTPSYSKEEDTTADIIELYLINKGINTRRIGNNIIAIQSINVNKPIIVLNSHHDTVKPCEGWDTDPFSTQIKGNKITGLGSNDAGAALVSLIMTFIHYYQIETDYQLILICSAEEEISGDGGIKSVLKEMQLKPELAIVGEPTSTQMATSEKSLLVIDAVASGKSGHAAHQIDDNAIYNALVDIQAIENLRFEKVSDQLGPVKLTVTQIAAGHQHNVIPDTCEFVIDCRINEKYTHEECLEKLTASCSSVLTPRSTHLRSSGIPLSHPIVRAGIKLGKTCYGSPTLSDQVFFLCPSIKIGPGESSRSHQANEYILTEEITEGIKTYISLLNNLKI